jgi:nuclear pore complex protein Nup98-Nup96
LDKQTGQPLRDGPTMLSWEKKLRSMCARLGAKFVSYKTDGGVWKFEVRTFLALSLYPLIHSI